MDININDLRYVIFDYSEVNQIDFNEVLDTSADTIRLSADGTRSIVKWAGNEPQCISNLTSKSVIYNNEEMLNIVELPEWNYNIVTSGTTE